MYDANLCDTLTFLKSAKLFDVVFLEELQSYLEGVLLFAKNKNVVRKHELNLCAKLAALNYLQMKKANIQSKFKQAKFHYIDNAAAEQVDGFEE